MGRKILIRVVRVVIAVYVGLLLLYGLMQRNFLYYPWKVSTEQATAEAQKAGLTAWTDAHGQFHGWRTARSDTDSSWLVFHGNAGNALHRDYYIDLIEGLLPDGNPEIFICEYPGFGPRNGKPSEGGFFEVAEAAVRALVEERSDRTIYIIGESIGSGPACHAAEIFGGKLSGLLLVTPFDDLAHVAKHHFPYLPVKLILRDRFRNARALESYDGRVAIIVAERDEVVPARFGHALHASYHGPARIWEVAGGTHNTLSFMATEAFWQEAVRFLTGDTGE